MSHYWLAGAKGKLKVTFCLFRTSISFICFLKPAISSFFCFSRRLFSASSCSMRFLSCSPESWERDNKYSKKLQVFEKYTQAKCKTFFFASEFYLQENKKSFSYQWLEASRKWPSYGTILQSRQNEAANSSKRHWWRDPDGFRKLWVTFKKLLVVKNISL